MHRLAFEFTRTADLGLRVTVKQEKRGRNILERNAAIAFFRDFRDAMLAEGAYVYGNTDCPDASFVLPFGKALHLTKPPSP